jgi:hypothetical protein
MPVQRFSSRRAPLHEMLSERLKRAKKYDRIAGYFRSSLLDVVGEELSGVDEIRVVCNGELDPADIATAKVAKAAKEGNDAVAKTLVSLWQGTEDSIDVLLKLGAEGKLPTSGHAQGRLELVNTRLMRLTRRRRGRQPPTGRGAKA